MRNREIHLALMLCMLFPLAMSAQTTEPQDSVPDTKVTRNRNVMLNASSDSKPRQISIGLPDDGGAGTTIFEDGLPVSFCYWPDMSSTSWRDGNSLSSNTLMSLSEGAIQFGQVGYIVNSFSRMASDRFKGLATYTLSQHGKQLFDVNLSSPIGKGWGLSLSSFQNFDPGSNHITSMPHQEKTHIYKAGISKSFARGKGQMSLLYQYADYFNFTDNKGIFLYNGRDGSVDAYPGFNLGKDSYFPDITSLEYLDMGTGKMEKTSLEDGLRTRNHQLTFRLDYDLRSGNHFSVSSKFKSGRVRNMFFFVVGLFPATQEDGYTYENGERYEGMVQNRYLMYHKAFEKSFMTTAQLSGKTQDGRHAWRLGLNEWYNRAGIETSTAMYAHQAAADPLHLLHNGRLGTDYNTGSEFYNGHENKLAVFASDDWYITRRLFISAGTRLEWQNAGGQGMFAYKADGTLFEPQNIHSENFSMAKGKKNRYGTNNYINPVLSLDARYTLLKGFGLMGEYVWAHEHTNMQDYAGPYLPLEDAINYHMMRGGVFWNNRYIQLTSQVFHITRNNYKNRDRFTNPEDPTETIVLPIVNGVATTGWTTDFLLTPFQGFQFHGLFTYQDPKYTDFVFQPVFSTGPGKKYDLSGNNVTGMSKVIIEMDPSYQRGSWRFWLSFRYQSKEYINKTNSLYFKGRWETFGGVDFTLNKNVAFSLNVVNILGQKGASGSISAADLATDVQQYQSAYPMSGSFIRPFTVEFSTRMSF